MKLKAIVGAMVLALAVAPAQAKNKGMPQGQASGASGSSCSEWLAVCQGRGGHQTCADKFNACKKSGCFTEAPKFGGAMHCGMAKN